MVSLVGVGCTACVHVMVLLLKTVSTFRYLGTDIFNNKGMLAAHEVTRCAATKAMWSMMQHTRDRDIFNSRISVQLFSSMGYGVWSTL